jgi:hypothetical protein
VVLVLNVTKPAKLEEVKKTNADKESTVLKKDAYIMLWEKDKKTENNSLLS